MALGLETHRTLLPLDVAQEAAAVLKRVPLELVQELVQCAADELVREQLLGDARAQTTTATLQSKWEGQLVCYWCWQWREGRLTIVCCCVDRDRT